MSDAVAGPPVTLDPRFRAGRTLVQTGRAGEGAIDIFETLVQESRTEFGEASVEAAACYYEYGNALFRAAARRSINDQEQQPESLPEAGDNDKKPAAMETLEKENQSTPDTEDTATKLAADKANGNKATEPETITDQSNNQAEKEDTDKEGESDDDDVGLALEMMETAWSILDKYVQEDSHDTSNKATHLDWALDQLPRILLGIGDVLSSLERQADAADAYSRAIPHREAALEHFKKDALGLDHLRKRRQLVEANVLVAEALLACPANEDVITTETNDLLVKASERVEYARGYYDKGRDELQETVFLMGKIAASGKDLGDEKEDVCFISTLLMGVGTTLAALDEQGQEGEDSKPAAKKLKT